MLAAPVKVATGAEPVVEAAAVETGTVKVAMPPVGAETVTVLLGAPELRAGAADEAELKGAKAPVALGAALEAPDATEAAAVLEAPAAAAETGKVDVETGTEEVTTMVDEAGHEVTVGAQLVIVTTVVE